MKNLYRAFFISLICSIIIILVQQNSFENILSFFSMPFSSKYFVGYFLDKFSLLLISCVGCFFALSTNNINLGGQGQIYIGGFLTSLILANCPSINFLNPFFLFFTFILVFLSGGIICFISFYLKLKKGINELLTTFMVSTFIIQILDFVISNPLKDKTTNLLAMKEINNIFKIPHWQNFSTFNFSILFSLLFALCCYLFFTKTLLGKKVLLSGKAPEFSKFRGYNVNTYNFFTMIISGGLNSICGFFAVIGTYYTCYQGFYSSFGWNALTAALICSNNSKLIIPATLLISYFFTATDCAMITNSISSGTSGIVQGILLLSTAIPYLQKEK